MSHKIFKNLALVSLVGLSGLMVASDAYADEKPSVKFSGKLRSYVGQYNSGVKHTSTALVEFGEVNLGTNIKSGPLKAYFELESRNQNTLYAIQRRADATFGNLKVSFGTIKPKASYALADDSESGTMTSQSNGFGFYKGQLIKTETQGIGFEYKIGKIKLNTSLYSVDALNSVRYKFTNGKVAGTANLTSGQVSASATNKSNAFGVREYKPGSGTQVGARGSLGSLQFHLSGITTKTDNHTATATILNHSGHQAGVRYELFDGFKISVDSGAKSIAKDQTATKKTSDAALQIQYKIGDDKIVITQASVDYKESDKSSKNYKRAITNVVYKMRLANRSDMNFLYASSQKTSNAGTTVTKSFFGAGLFVKF